ncbi:MAG: hypothetical protein ACLR5T_04390 [Veillonella sp.]
MNGKYWLLRIQKIVYPLWNGQINSDELPDETLWIYLTPIDDTSRSIILEVITLQQKI